MKKAFLISILFLFCNGTFLSQSLVEIAKKERARRSRIKNKATIITNADLKKVNLSPPVAVNNEQAQVAAPAPGPVEPPQKTPVKLARRDAERGSEAPSASQSLEEKWQKAVEYVELLSIKMRGLWQEFYSLDDMTPRDLIQQQISQTYLQLQKAQKDADLLKEKLDKQPPKK